MKKVIDEYWGWMTNISIFMVVLIVVVTTLMFFYADIDLSMAEKPTFVDWMLIGMAVITPVYLFGSFIRETIKLSRK